MSWIPEKLPHWVPTEAEVAADNRRLMALYEIRQADGYDAKLAAAWHKTLLIAIADLKRIRSES